MGKVKPINNTFNQIYKEDLRRCYNQIEFLFKLHENKKAGESGGGFF